MKRIWPILLLLAACANNPAPQPTPDTADFDISLDKATLSLEAGKSGPLTVSVVPTNGFNRDVDLSYVRVSAPNSVSGGFSISPTKTSSVFTLSVDAATAPGSYTLLIRGTALVQGASAKREKEITLTVPAPTTQTIGGTVKNYVGVPISGATVRYSDTLFSTTDADGKFILSGITAPYDLTVSVVGGPTRHVFMGLNRLDPTLMLFDTNAGFPLQAGATVGGTLSAASGSGITLPNPANTATQLAFSSTNANLTDYLLPNLLNLTQLGAGQGPAYSGMTVGWNGSTSTTGTVHALQWRYNASDPGRPEQFLGYGSRDVALTNGGTLSAANITLSAITSGSLTSTVTVPSGLALVNRYLFVQLAQRNVFFIAFNAAASPTNLSWPTPVIAGKPLSFFAEAKNADGRYSNLQMVGLQPSQVINPVLDTPATLTSPTAGQTGVALSSALTFGKPANRIALVTLSAAGDSRIFYTSASSLTPTLLAGKNYSWLVSTVGPFTDMDEFTGNAWASGYPTAGWDKAFYGTISAVKTFSTP